MNFSYFFHSRFLFVIEFLLCIGLFSVPLPKRGKPLPRIAAFVFVMFAAALLWWNFSLSRFPIGILM